jgi:2-dehydro-3-deoxygluconokinase
VPRTATGRECVCLGETMVMVTPSGAEPLEAAETCLLRPGGAESNVAMYLARLGHDVAWAGRVGDDPLGRLLVRRISEAGVDASLVEASPAAPTGVYFKDPGPDGTRVLYYRRGSAAAAMDRSVVDLLAGDPPRLLHLSGITAALSTSCADLTRHLLVDRPLGKTIVSFDVNHRPALWAGDAGQELLHLARHADVVFVGLDEAHRLWGSAGAADVRDVLGPDPVLVVKDGAVGATCFHSEGTTAVPALDVEVLEPVGAGDAFAAGWLSAALRGLDHEARLRTGHLLAGVALTSVADHAEPPGRAELDAALALDAAGWAALKIVSRDYGRTG